MSREFRIWVSVEMAPSDRHLDIEEVLEAQWPFKEFETSHYKDRYVVSSVGDGNLGGGQTVETFARGLRRAVWKGMRKYVEVTVRALCLDDPEAFHGSEPEFARERDAGLLSWSCEDCGDTLPFGCTDDLCAGCAAKEAADIPGEGKGI